eukprot:tig00021128_g18884.t1
MRPPLLSPLRWTPSSPCECSPVAPLFLPVPPPISTVCGKSPLELLDSAARQASVITVAHSARVSPTFTLLSCEPKNALTVTNDLVRFLGIRSLQVPAQELLSFGAHHQALFLQACAGTTATSLVILDVALEDLPAIYSTPIPWAHNVLLKILATPEQLCSGRLPTPTSSWGKFFENGANCLGTVALEFWDNSLQLPQHTTFFHYPTNRSNPISPPYPF